MGRNLGDAGDGDVIMGCSLGDAGDGDVIVVMYMNWAAHNHKTIK